MCGTVQLFEFFCAFVEMIAAVGRACRSLSCKRHVCSVLESRPELTHTRITATTMWPTTQIAQFSKAGAWRPPTKQDDGDDDESVQGEAGRRPKGGGAHFPGSVPLTHVHPHKSVVKIGENEWQASLFLNDDFHELGVFPTKAAAAEEVQAWTDLINDEGEAEFSIDGVASAPSGGTTKWVRPDVAHLSDNPILRIGKTSEDGNDEDQPKVALDSNGNPILSLVEVVECLEYENAENITALDISTHMGGGGHLGDYLVTATGKSNAHLRKMGDVLVKALQLRDMWELQPMVEGRDDHDGWMVVDCGNLIVQLVDQEARDYYSVEALWKHNGCVEVRYEYKE